MIEQSVVSTEYVRVRVDAYKQGVLDDPSGDVVAFAFTADDDLDAVEWWPGSWEVDRTLRAEKYVARCLVGPDGGEVELEPGVYKVWVKITTTSETPVKQAGLILFY